MKFALAVAFLSSLAWGQLPDAPSADRAFWINTSASGLATLADGITTVKLVGHTETCPFEEWGSSLYGRTPTAGRVTLVMGGLWGASALVSYELKRHRVHLWKLPLWPVPESYLAYGHASGAIHNLRTCH
jgi:hypothetical protein